MPFKIPQASIRRVLKSPYIVYPLIIFVVVLLYTYMFLVLEAGGNFNVKGSDFLKAFYWVVVTMSTTGYGDIYPVTAAGEVFSLIVILTGLTIFFAIVLPLVVTPGIERWLKAPHGKLPDKTKGHVVICGYDPLVDTLIAELAAMGKVFVIVDESAGHVKGLQGKGYFAIHGDPSDEDVLRMARVEHAATMIANMNDAKNAAAALTASQISGCNIIVIVENLVMAEYMRSAGARVVVSPKQMLGLNMGRVALSSLSFEASSVLDLGIDLKICQVPMTPDNPMVGRKLKDVRLREETGVSVIAMFKDGEFIVNPPASLTIDETTVLAVMGTGEQVGKIGRVSSYRRPACAGDTIIAGFGDVGKEVAKRLDEKGMSYTIIDMKAYPEKKQVIGDSSDREVLKNAGVESASTLLVTLNDDDKNMLTTLLSRSMNPHLNIIVRANLDRSVKKLYRAGADYVISLSTVGGQMLAKIVEKGVFEDSALLSENVIIAKYPVAGSGLEGRTIKETAMRTKTGCTVVGVMEDGSFYPNPGPEQYLNKDMVVIVVGTIKQLDNCAGTYGLNRLP